MLAFKKNSANLQLGGFNISLDGRGETSFISHAHSDHSAGAKSAKGIISSEETLDLILSREWHPETLKKKRIEKIDGAKIELLNAGHVLGSRQFHVENSVSFTYTSDFKLRDSLTQKAAEVKDAELLLMECTYGLPSFSFPSNEQTYDEISKWVSSEMNAGNSILLGGYALGKAQELVKLLNEYLKITPVVTNPIYQICKTYDKHGIKLGALNETSEEGKEALQKQFVAIVPHHHANLRLANHLSEYYKKPVKSAVATGWAISGRTPNAHRTFCLSDHADFKQLLEYAERSNAKKIICMHGYSEAFSKELKKRGYDACAIEDMAETAQQKLLC